MIKHYILTLLFAVLIRGVSWAVGFPVDSVGTEKRNGKTFVVHKVAPKETLFALSRKYQVPVEQIVDANPRIQSGLNVGQLVYIPRKTVAAMPAKAVAAATPRTFVVDARGNKIHTVEEKQTLFAIAKLYNISTADLKKWNKLTSNNVSVGDKLVVGVGNKPTANPQYVQEIDDDVDKVKSAPAKTTANNKPVTLPKQADEPITRAEPATERNQPAERNTPTEPAADEADDNTRAESISKVTESGLAELIDNRSESNKYLALHKTAPIGTILQVKNIMNNQTVYVRVIGKLPATGVNERVIVKISNRAYQKLAALDNRFRVEVSYMP